MNNPLISIIVPVYNVEEYIHECIDSILGQSLSDFELILVDDNSSDNSGKICDEYAKKDCRVKVIHKENGGLSSARNAGLDIAIGHFIGFVDSDDYVDENMYQYLIDSIKYNNCEISCCGIKRDYNGIITPHIFWPKDTIVYTNLHSIELLISKNGCGDYAVNKLYVRKLFNGIRYPEGKKFEDIFTTYKLFSRANNVVFVNRALYYYRYRVFSITKSLEFDISLYDFVISCKEQLNYVEERYPDYTEMSIAKYINANIIIAKDLVSKKVICDNWSMLKELKSNILSLKNSIQNNKYISRQLALNCMIYEKSILLWIIHHKLSNNKVISTRPNLKVLSDRYLHKLFLKNRYNIDKNNEY